MAAPSPLGDFLRARRAQVDPGRHRPHRRWGPPGAGLRREEVAVLAGVSADYHARLEPGPGGIAPQLGAVPCRAVAGLCNVIGR